MLFENYITNNKKEFIDKVDAISRQLAIDPDWLMAVMAFETACTFSPGARNAQTGAVGLIQFMPSTAKDLGTTTEALSVMSNVKQLDYVYKYLAKYRSKLAEFTDVYLAIFYPTAIGKSDSFILGGNKLAEQNPIFDKDKNGLVTKGEVTEVINEWVYKKTGRKFIVVEISPKKKIAKLLLWTIILLGSIGAVTYLSKKNKK